MPTKMDIAVMGIVCVIFALATIYWVNSPGYHAEIDYQRQHAIEFLRENQNDMAHQDRDAVMEHYGITPEEISPIFLLPR